MGEAFTPWFPTVKGGNMSESTNEPQAKTSGLTIFYGVMAIVLGLIAAYAMDEKQFGTVSKVFGFISGTIFSFIGVYIGDFVRKAVLPDVIYSSGMTDMIKQKLFWFIGPQLIGGAIGAFVGASIIGFIVK